MNGNIKVGSESIASQLSQFQAEMTNMQNLFTELETQTASVNNFWEGAGSDATVGAIKNFMKTFNDVKAQNDKYVAFLNGVIDKYTTTENKISESIDAAANSGLGINGSGN